LHALGHGHRPRGVDYKQDQVGRAFDPHFALQVAHLDRKGHLPGVALLLARALERRSCAKGRVERQVVGLAARRARLVPPAGRAWM